ncbi:MAG: NERD domain-containing protein, partial [Desulfobulbaceae bacterium]|nr:NERD domain-containing protein [Desulfobulbaceae bacterium]
MAQMIPQDIKQLSANASPGEKALYRIVQKHTPDNWICYAGQRLGTGTTPDFVIISPELGVLVLVEKNIPIHMIEGATTESWTVVRDGTSQESTHPLRQARGYVEKAAQEMGKFPRLTDDKGRLKFVYGHGVVLYGLSSQDLRQANVFHLTPLVNTFEPKLVICSDQLPGKRDSESDFAERLLGMTRLFKFENLDDDDILTIRGALFPEVQARGLADALRDKNSVLESLTIEQEQYARGIGQNDKVPHRRLNGVAGCGKSIILRVRAISVARENPDWKILLTFFTRSLKKYLS